MWEVPLKKQRFLFGFYFAVDDFLYGTQIKSHTKKTKMRCSVYSETLLTFREKLILILTLPIFEKMSSLQRVHEAEFEKKCFLTSEYCTKKHRKNLTRRNLRHELKYNIFLIEPICHRFQLVDRHVTTCIPGHYSLLSMKKCWASMWSSKILVTGKMMWIMVVH